jgi:hypothetical protein
MQSKDVPSSAPCGVGTFFVASNQKIPLPPIGTRGIRYPNAIAAAARRAKAVIPIPANHPTPSTHPTAHARITIG